MALNCTVEKEKGTVIITGLELGLAIHLRKVFEKQFDALVTLTVETDDYTQLRIRGAGDEDLGKDETADKYRMWLRGWYVGYQEPRELDL